jgi:hypothetical protein
MKSTAFLRAPGYLQSDMSTLHSRLQEIAHEFVESVLGALKSAPLDDLLGQGHVEKRRTVVPPTSRSPMAVPKGSRSSGRLPRRSADEIGQALEQANRGH